MALWPVAQGNHSNVQLCKLISLEIVLGLGLGFGINRGGATVLKVGYNEKTLHPHLFTSCIPGVMKRNIAQLSLVQLLHLNASGVFRMCEREEGLGDKSSVGSKSPGRGLGNEVSQKLKLFVNE